MKSILLCSTKGGTGKSTTTMLLYYELKRMFPKKKIAVLDLDTQKSVEVITNQFTEHKINCIGIAEFNEGKQDLVLIDSPPYIEQIPNKIDLAIVLAKPTYLDMLSINTMHSELMSRKINSVLLFNQVQSNTAISEEVQRIVKDYNINKLTSQLTLRTVYQRAVMFGGVHLDTDKKAKDQIEQLAKEVLKLIK